MRGNETRIHNFCWNTSWTSDVRCKVNIHVNLGRIRFGDVDSEP
jgi:hypothetical protein